MNRCPSRGTKTVKAINAKFFENDNKVEVQIHECMFEEECQVFSVLIVL